MAKLITAEKARAGLRHEAVCPNVTKRTNERIAQSKHVCAGLLATVDKSQVGRTCILRSLFVCRCRVDFLWLNVRYASGPTATRSYLTVCVLYCFVFVLFSWRMSLFTFSPVFCTIVVSSSPPALSAPDPLPPPPPERC